MAGISAALKASGCTPDEELAAAKQFIADDVQDPSDLGDDPGKAGTKIDEILAKTKLGSDARANIKKAMLDALSKEKKEPVPAAPPKLPSSTSIEAVLNAIQGITKEEGAKVLAEFDEQGIIELADLGKDKDKQSAEAKIDKILGSTGLAKDKSDLCKKALTTAWKKETDKPGAAQPSTTGTQPPTTASTTVPPGGVDITSPSFPTLKAEKEGSTTTFTIPAELKTAQEGTIVSADELEPWQWIILAKRNNLTTALDLKKVVNPNYEDAHADKPAFLWEKQSGAIIDTTEGEVSSRVSVSIEEDLAAKHMMADASIAGNYAFCEASVKASYKTEAQENLYSKVVHVRARWRANKCKLTMPNCLKLAPIFQHLIDRALAQKPEDQFDFLSQLFDKFGHVVPKYVYLGGQLELSRDVVSVEGESKASTTTHVDTAIKAKVEGGGGGAATIGYGTDNTGTRKQSKFFSNVTFVSIGGKPSLVTDPKDWDTSDPALWKIIYQENVTPITEWLGLDQRNQIDAIAAKKKSEAWKISFVPDLMKKDPQQTLPYFPLDDLVTFKSWRASASDRVYLEAKNGVFGGGNTPDARAQDEYSRDAYGNNVPPGDPRRVDGKYYPWCQPAPLRALSGAGDSPKDAGLYWKLVYTGQPSANHEALYWIVTTDEQWALSVFRMVDYGNFACLLPYEEAKKLRTQNSPPRWIFRPAVPPGRLELDPLPDENSGYFRLFNPFCNGYLADEALCDTWRKYVTYVEGHGWTPDSGYARGGDVTHEEAGPQIGRTMVRSESAAELSSIFDATTGKIKEDKDTSAAALEAAQQKTYKTRCWLIQDRRERPSPKQFRELENSYIENWINANPAK